jgi:site-specific DNA recombinase
MRQKALQGGFNGMSAPFGYDVRAGGLAINDGEAAIVRKICTWRRRGRSFAWIAEALNRDGVPTKKGKVWTKRQLFRIVHNPLYRGSLHWEDIEIPGTHPAIVAWSPEKDRRRATRRRVD